MSCSGLHCAGCAGGSAAPVLGPAAFLGVDWVVTHIVEVTVVSAVCGALAVAAVVALMRWTERREARHAAEVTLWSAREVPAALTRPARPAIAPAVVNLNFYGVPATEAAGIIRTAIPGTAGDAITEGK